MVEDTLTEVELYRQSAYFAYGFLAGATAEAITSDEEDYNNKESVGFGFGVALASDGAEEAAQALQIVNQEVFRPDIYAANTLGVAAGLKAMNKFSELWE